jgi:3',5'-cyclic AMP phosphodiesterase CpdA
LRVVAHVSDLHFGRLDPSTLPALAHAITAAQPDALVVSGDLTQRAREREFVEARAFLDSLPFPKIVVPGNHDIPLYDVVARSLRPLARYKRHIAEETEPFYADAEMAIAGINTARSLTVSGGRINKRQAQRVCRYFGSADGGRTRIVVTHHPFDLPDRSDFNGLVGRAKMAVAAFAQCRVDIVLSGHMHIGGADESTVRYRMPGRSMLLVQAGTASSSRRRGKANSCNIIRINRPRIDIDHLEWDDERNDFSVAAAHAFLLGEGGWARAP